MQIAFERNGDVLNRSGPGVDFGDWQGFIYLRSVALGQDPFLMILLGAPSPHQPRAPVGGAFLFSGFWPLQFSTALLVQPVKFLDRIQLGR